MQNAESLMLLQGTPEPGSCGCTGPPLFLLSLVLFSLPSSLLFLSSINSLLRTVNTITQDC